MGFTSVLWEAKDMPSARGKLLHTPVCPISGSPRVAREKHTRGSFMGPIEFCYLGWFVRSTSMLCLICLSLYTIN